MALLNSRSFAKVRKHRKLKILLSAAFFLFLLFLYLLFVIQIRERIGPVKMANFHRHLDDSLLYSKNGFSIDSKQYDTTAMIVIMGARRLYQPFIFVLISSFIFFAYQALRNKKLYTLPALFFHLPLLVIFIYCDVQTENSVCLFDLYRLELVTLRGNISLFLYSLLLVSLIFYFIAEIRKAFKDKKSVSNKKAVT